MIDLQKLSEYLKESDASTITLSFPQIEGILGCKLPDEAKENGKWWWNIKDSKKARFWLDYGYYTVDHKYVQVRGNVCFRRIEQEAELRKGFDRIWYFLTDKDAESHQKAMAFLEISVIPVVAILTLIVAILTFYVTVSPVKSQDRIQEVFATFVSEGDYSFENKNFLDAAGYYHRASLNSYDIYSEVYSRQREGMCYFLHGMLEQDKNYLNRAFMIYQSIVDTPKYENTDIYREALIDICSLYRWLDYDWQNEKWISIVDQLETMFCFDNLDNIPNDCIPTYISAAVSLSYYYKTALLSEKYSYIFDEDHQEKAIYYCNAAAQLQRRYDKYSGISLYDLNYLISIHELTSYMIVNAFGNAKDDILETLEEARVLCQNAILTMNLEAGNMLQLNVYIELKRNIGKSYIFSAYASKSPDRENYMLKAYQELITLFNWDNDEVNENLMHVSNYILLTGNCTEKDIQLILDRLSSYLQVIKEYKDISQLIYVEMTSLVTCDAILLYYDYETSNVNATAFGKQLWADLHTTLFDFLDSNQKAELDKYAEKFGT